MTSTTTATTTIPSSSGRASVPSIGNESTTSSNTSNADNTSVISTPSFYQLMPTVIRNKRETPERKRDKIIPLKFMHLLWFAGLRGAVAYACAREFPDVYGHRDEFIAATMVIVIITIVLMGGLTESLMDFLGIRMNVDNDEYMKSWHQQRKLKGRFLHFEYHWIYRFVVTEQSIQYMDEQCGYIEQVNDGIHKVRVDEQFSVADCCNRHSSQQDGLGLDTSILTEDSTKCGSLINQHEEDNCSICDENPLSN